MLLIVGLAVIGLCAVGSWVISRAGEVVNDVSGQVDRIANPTVERAVTDAPVYTVSATRLAETYDANEVAANGQYGGRSVAVTGTVAEIGDSPLTVRLDGGAIGVGVMCEFTPDWRGQLAGLKSGQQVRIVGVVKGKGAFYVRLARCRLEP
jgi:hypothetical protein